MKALKDDILLEIWFVSLEMKCVFVPYPVSVNFVCILLCLTLNKGRIADSGMMYSTQLEMAFILLFSYFRLNGNQTFFVKRHEAAGCFLQGFAKGKF